MVAVGLSGPSVQTTEDQLLMPTDGSSQLSLISLVACPASAEGSSRWPRPSFASPRRHPGRSVALLLPCGSAAQRRVPERVQTREASS